jgi:hypothetical protein
MYPSAFMQLKDQYRCYDCACTKRNKDPNYIEKTKLGKNRTFQDPKWQEANRKRWDDPLFRERNKLKNQELANDPIWKENHRKGQNKMKSDPDYQKMMTEKNQKLSNDPVWKEHIKMGAVKRSQNPQWILNNKLHIERITKDPLCRAALKRSLNTPEHHKKVSGENSHKWKGGISPLVMIIRGSVKMKDWKDAIFKRDGYKDYLSGCKGDIVAHHINPFAKIIEQYKITTLEEALNCDALWDINNGITMLRSSHLAYHNMWGNDYE